MKHNWLCDNKYEIYDIPVYILSIYNKYSSKPTMKILCNTNTMVSIIVVNIENIV